MEEHVKEAGSYVSKYLESKEDYFDFNIMDKKELRIVVDKENTNISKSTDKGCKLRLWDGEKFLEEASTKIDVNTIKKNIESLEKRKQSQDNFETKKIKIDQTKDSKTFSQEEEGKLSLEEKTKKIKELRNKVSSLEHVVNCRAAFIEEVEHHLFVNKYKHYYQDIIGKVLVVVAYIKSESGEIKLVYESIVSDNDSEMFETILTKIDSIKKGISRKFSAKKLKGGKYHAVLSPKITGLLAHESFGHGMEADTMMKGRALASEWSGKKVAEANVSIVDYPNISKKHGFFNFDHEGNLAQKTYLVKNGIITTPMADLYSKTKLDLEQSSNGRFESFDHKHYTRMSNTYFEEGDKEVEELISKVKDGIFVIDAMGGMEDPKSWGVQIQNCSGIKIKDGKLTNEYVDGFALTGFLPDIMSNIEGISKNIEIEGGGMCGKGHKEWVRVAEGGPHLLINGVILG